MWTPLLIATGLAACLWLGATPPASAPDAVALQDLARRAHSEPAAEMRLRHWAKAGLPVARRELGRLWLGRAGMQRDAFHQIELAAREGDAEAALMLAHWLRNSPRAAEAVGWYRLALAGDKAEAALALGQMALAGEGMPANLELATHWLRLAAHMGDSEARGLLSVDREVHASL